MNRWLQELQINGIETIVMQTYSMHVTYKLLNKEKIRNSGTSMQSNQWWHTITSGVIVIMKKKNHKC